MRLVPLVVLCALSCNKPPAVIPELPWMPGAIFRTERAPSARGLVDRRGLIHSHSIYSHDACDGMPRPDGGYDQSCLEDFRRGLCQSMHDFAFLTDHRDSFDENDFPDVLLYRAAKGDVLIEHGSGPTANRMACENGSPAPLIMAGCETSPMMPVGLERHAPGKGATYGSDTPEALLEVKDAGAVALVAHTEGWTADQLTNLPLDGFEMYNLHANTFKNLSLVADWMLKIDAKMFDGLPDPNVFLSGYKLEDPAYLTTWGTVLSRGVKRVTTMGTDCHRNSLPQLAQDGERIDSYRRMMQMFSNHLLVAAKADGTFDDRDLKDALRAGRLYGSFDFMGYPVGFDFTATEGSEVREMGAEVQLSRGVSLSVAVPKVLHLNPESEAPVVTVHLYRARDGGWDEVASGGAEATLTFTPMVAGAYRAEVRMVPKHLKASMGKRLDLIREERPWVYSNAIYVR